MPGRSTSKSSTLLRPAVDADSEFELTVPVPLRFFCSGSKTMQAIKRACQEELARAEKALPPGARCLRQPAVVDSPISGVSAFQDFLNLHRNAFEILIQATVHLTNRGRGAEAFREDPLVMHVIVTPTTPAHPKPWNTWKIKQITHRSLKERIKQDAAFAKIWLEECQPSQAEQEEALRERFGDRYVGQIPVVYFVESTYMMFAMCVPIFALNDPDALQGVQAKATLHDLKSLCMGYINMGVPLYAWGPHIVPVRWMKKERDNGLKDWACEPTGTPERPWDNRYLKVFKTHQRRTRLGPQEVFRFFTQLLTPFAIDYYRVLTPGTSIIFSLRRCRQAHMHYLTAHLEGESIVDLYRRGPTVV